MYPVKHFFTTSLDITQLEQAIRMMVKERKRNRLCPNLRSYPDTEAGDICGEPCRRSLVIWIINKTVEGALSPSFILDYGVIGNWQVVSIKVRFNLLTQLIFIPIYVVMLYCIFSITGFLLPGDEDLLVLMVRGLVSIFLFSLFFYLSLTLFRRLKRQTLEKLQEKLTLKEIPWEKHSLLFYAFYVPQD